jgi:hypothetical protein
MPPIRAAADLVHSLTDLGSRIPRATPVESLQSNGMA